MPPIDDSEKKDAIPSLDSQEVAIHELGEALAISSVSIRRELQRYPDEMGFFFVEDFEIDLPVRLRIDSLGQVMATALSKTEGDDAIARIRIKLKPGNKPITTIPIIADVPLNILESFSDSEIETLSKYRIFSVEDFIRICRNTSGRFHLSKIILPKSITSAMQTAELLTLPCIPSTVATKLIKNRIRSISDFLKKDPKELATILKKEDLPELNESDIVGWKNATNQHLRK